jgi:hypothetical protein
VGRLSPPARFPPALSTPALSADLAPDSASARCPNCGEDVLGRFCHGCGQRHRETPSLRRFVAEGIGEILSFDGRFWRTLRPLLFQPGRLSAEYLAGRRARYVPPVRLYLIVSLVYFAAFTLLDARHFFGVQLDGIEDLLPQVMFFVVPAFALLLHLFFGRARRRYLEHLIVALHGHAFTFLVFTAHLLLDTHVRQGRGTVLAWVASAADALLHLWLFAYFFWMLRAVYGSSRVATALKGTLLLAGHLAILLAAAIAVYYARIPFL